MAKSRTEPTQKTKKERAANRIEIKNDLLDQLDRNGTMGKYYLDLVDDYMNLWDMKNELIDDIKNRGVVAPYTSNTGQSNLKKNESVGELLKVNDRMTKLLDSLGISPTQIDEGCDDDDEM